MRFGQVVHIMENASKKYESSGRVAIQMLRGGQTGVMKLSEVKNITSTYHEVLK